MLVAAAVVIAVFWHRFVRVCVLAKTFPRNAPPPNYHIERCSDFKGVRKVHSLMIVARELDLETRGYCSWKISFCCLVFASF